MGERLESEVLMPIIKRQGGFVVHSRFKNHGVALRLAQALFRNRQKFRANAVLADFRKHVDGNDMSFIAAAYFRHDEAENGFVRS